MLIVFLICRQRSYKWKQHNAFECGCLTLETMLPSWKELVAFSAQVATLQEAGGSCEVGLQAEGSPADLAPFVIQPSQAANQLLQQLLLTPVYTSVLQPEPTLLCPDSVTRCTPASGVAGPLLPQSRGTVPPGSSPTRIHTRGPAAGASHQLTDAQALHPRGESAAGAGRAVAKPVAQTAGNPANALPHNTTPAARQAPGRVLQQQQQIQQHLQVQHHHSLGPAAADDTHAGPSGWVAPEELLPAPLAAPNWASNSKFVIHNSTFGGGRAANGTPAPHAGVQPVAAAAIAPASLAPLAAPARKAPKDGLKHLIQLHQQEQAKKKKREQQQQQQKPPKRRRLQGGAGVAAGSEPGALEAGARAGPVAPEAEQRVPNGSVQVPRERDVGGEGDQGAWGQEQGPAGEGDGEAGGGSAAAGLGEPDAAGDDDAHAAEGFGDDMDLAAAFGAADGEDGAAGGHAPAGLCGVAGARDSANADAGADAGEVQGDSDGANERDTDDDDLPLAQLVVAGDAIGHGTHRDHEGTGDQLGAEPAHVDTVQGFMEPGQQGGAALTGAPPRRPTTRAAAAEAAAPAAAAARAGAARAARAPYGVGAQQPHAGAESLQPAFREGGPGGGGLAIYGSAQGGQEGTGEGAVCGAGDQGLEDQPLVPIVKVRPHRELSALASVSLASLVSVGAAAGAGSRTRAAGGGRGAQRQGQGVASGVATMERAAGLLGTGGREGGPPAAAGGSAEVGGVVEDEEDEAYARAAAARLGAVLGGPRHAGRGSEAAAGVPGAGVQRVREAEAAATAAAAQQHAADWAAAIAAGFDDGNDLSGAVVPPPPWVAPRSGGLVRAGGTATAAAGGAPGPDPGAAAMPGGGTASDFGAAALGGPVAGEGEEAAAASGHAVTWSQPHVQVVGEDQQQSQQYGHQQQQHEEAEDRAAQEEECEPEAAVGGQEVGGDDGAGLEATAGADVDSEAEAEEGEASDASAGSGLAADGWGGDGGEGWWTHEGGEEGAVGDAAAHGGWWAAGASQLQDRAGAGGRKAQQRGARAQARGRGRGKKVRVPGSFATC